MPKGKRKDLKGLLSNIFVRDYCMAWDEDIKKLLNCAESWHFLSLNKMNNNSLLSYNEMNDKIRTWSSSLQCLQKFTKSLCTQEIVWTLLTLVLKL